MKKKMSRPLKVATISLGSIIGIVLVVMVAISVMLTPARLTPMVERLSTQYLNATVSFDTVRLSLFEEFPYSTISLRGAQIISHAPSQRDSCDTSVPINILRQADTLARVGSLDISIDPIKAIFGTISVKRIRVANSHIHALVDSRGRANYDIATPSQDSSTAESAMPQIDITRITLRNGCHVHYYNVADSLSGEMELSGFHLRGRLTTALDELDVERLSLRGCTAQFVQYMGDQLRETTHSACIDSVTMRGSRDKGYTLGIDTRHIRSVEPISVDSLAVHGFVKLQSLRGVELRDMHIAVDGIPISIDGALSMPDSSGAIDFDQLRISGDSLPLERILALIPSPLTKNGRYQTMLRPSLHAAIHGRFAPADSVHASITLPKVDARLTIPTGSLYDTHSKSGARLDTVDVDIRLAYDPSNAEASCIEVNRLKLAGFGIRLECRSTIENLMGDMMIKGVVKGRFDFTRLSTLFPSKNGVTTRGVVECELNGETHLSQLSLKRMGAATINGVVHCDTLEVVIPSSDLTLMVGRGRLTLGTGRSLGDSLVVDRTAMLSAQLDIDTMDMDISGSAGLCLQGRNIHFSARSDGALLSGDTSVVHPAAGCLAAERIVLELPDSTSMRGTMLDMDWFVRPSPKSLSIPLVECKIVADRAAWRTKSERYSTRKAEIDLAVTLYEVDSTRLKLRLDSLQRVYPSVERDRLMKHAQQQRKQGGSDLDNIDIAITDNSVKALLQRWDVQGRIRASRGRIITPYFPLQTSLSDVNISFSTDKISIAKSRIKAGESQISVTGQLSGLRRALLGSGRIRGSLEIDADTLNLNQILRTLDAGSKLVESGGVDHTDNDEQMQQRIIMSVDTSSSQPLSTIVVPGNLDLGIRLAVKQGMYASMHLDSLVTHVAIRGRAIRLSDFVMQSDAGEIRLTGIYATRSLHDIQAGFDVEMSKVKVEKLIELIPVIDTLMPMLRSFSGVLDCDVAMTTSIDSAMNIVMSSLNGACHIDGRNMVLMDGETFTEISKSLMFKKKARNVIDHVSAQVIVRDSTIQIFPFVISIDRYQAAVSGVHRLDMSFNYHISVLHSPAPFRLGLDVYGNLDDFKFKITRARYKSANIPSRIELIDTARLNLRTYMSELFAVGVNSARRNMSDIAPKVATPEQILPPAEELSSDSLAIITDTIATKTPMDERPAEQPPVGHQTAITTNQDDDNVTEMEQLSDTPRERRAKKRHEIRPHKETTKAK